MKALKSAKGRFISSFSTKSLGLRSCFSLMAMLLFSASLLASKVENEDTGQTYSDLQEAINNANSGNTLELHGTFQGNFIINKSLNLIGKHHAVLDGEQTGSVLTLNNTTPAIDVAIENITITNGSAANGGGINNNVNLTLKNVKVVRNTASNNGGGIANNYYLTGGYASLTLVHSVVAGNTAGNDGGGIYSTTVLTIEDDSEINGNRAVNGAGIFMTQEYSLGEITDTEIEHNIASGEGGGVYLDGITCTLIEVKVSKNSAENGGGFYNNEGFLTIEDSDVNKNQANVSGGGIYNITGSTLSLTSSHVERNVAGSHGGGIYDEPGVIIDITDSEIEENSPDDIYTQNSV